MEHTAFQSRVAAHCSSASKRRYERFQQYVALDRDVRAQLIATRRGHLIENLSQCDKRTLIQLCIRWWREVQVWVALFGAFEGYPWTYTEIITSDHLFTMLQERPYTIANHNEAAGLVAAVAASSYVGYITIDGKVYHES